MKCLRRNHLLMVGGLVVILLVGYTFRFYKDMQNIRALDNPRTCIEAMNYLARHKVSRAVPALTSLMKKGRDSFGLFAAKALGRIGTPEAVDALIAELKQRHRGTSLFAANALGQIGTPEAVDALVEEVEQETAAASWAAAALFHASDERSVPALLRAVKSEDGELRKAASLALSKFDRKECIPGLVEELEEYDAGIHHPRLREPLEDEFVNPTVLRSVKHAIGVNKAMADYCASKLKELTSQSFGYSADQSEENRVKAIQAWKQWLEDSYQPE